MKKKPLPLKFLGIISLAFLATFLMSSLPVLAAQDPWPKRFEDPRGAVIMYQPQVEDFKDDTLTARAAVSVKTKKMKAPLFGAVWLTGKLQADRDTRMATIDGIKVTDAKFPDSKPEQVEELKTFLNSELEEVSIPISMDRVLATLEVLEKEQAGDRGLKNDPPKIIFANHPTVLVLLDGDPKLLPVPKSSLMRVANTPFIMLYDPPAKTYYLRGGDDWLSAADLAGPWKDLETLPEPLKALEGEIQKVEKAKGKGAAKKVTAKAGKMPAVIVSTVPAELLVTEGDPQYTPIKGTNLLYVSNTESNIFMDTATQEHYAIVSGRWFKTKSLANGPWAYVAPDKLPSDFAKIPENSAKGFILVNVAGTTQAKEAVLENSIPQTAAIDRKRATTKVEYAGAPKFEKIADTDLEYAVNTGKSVFKEGAKYYALDQGVWYEATSPEGPWKVSASPPQQVDKIPPSNPNYNAKYVKVYDSNEDTVTVGYTPGYTGSYVDNGTVVYGTGYDYKGYSSPEAYIPPPATYGYAAAYDPYAGSWGYQTPYYYPGSWLAAGLTAAAVGVGVAAIANNWWDHGYWGGGGYWGAGGYNNVNIDNSHNNVIGGRPGERPGRPGERPGIGERPGRPSTLPSERRNLYNRPGNENRLASRPGKPGTRPGEGIGSGRPGQGPGERPGARPGGPGQAARPKAETRPAQAARPSQPKARPAGGQNNVLADRNGNVYRRDNQGNFQQRQGNQWSKPGGDRAAARSTPSARPSTMPQRPSAAARPTPAARPSAASRPSFDSGQLNRDFAARQRGQQRVQNFQRSGAASGLGGRGGGGMRAGGGGGMRGGGGGMRGGGGGGGGRGGGGGGRGGGGGGRR
jgi:hypothetical protein